MFCTTHTSLREVLSQIRKEQAKQFSVAETTDDVGDVVWVYSRPVSYMKESKPTK